MKRKPCIYSEVLYMQNNHKQSQRQTKILAIHITDKWPITLTQKEFLHVN